MFLRYLYDRFSLSIHLWLNTDWFHLLDIVNSGGIYPRVYKGFSFPHRWQYLWPFAFLVMAILTCLRWHITIVLIRYCDTSSLFFLPEFVLALFMSGYWSGVCFSFICSELHLVLLQLFFFLFSSHLASNGGQDCPSMGPEICGSQITPALRPSQRSCQLSQLQETSFSTTKPPVCWASRKVSGSYASWFQIEDFPALFTSCLSSEGGSYTHGTEKCSLQLFFFHSLPSKCLKCLVVSLGSIALTYFSWMRV